MRKKASVYAKVECCSEGHQRCLKAVALEVVNFITGLILEYVATQKTKCKNGRKRMR